MNIDYQVKLMDFKAGNNHEAITKNEDGSYTIFIDSALNYEQQRKKFLHALKHAIGDDFYKLDADKIEYVAHDCRSEISTELCIAL